MTAVILMLMVVKMMTRVMMMMMMVLMVKSANNNKHHSIFLGISVPDADLTCKFFILLLRCHQQTSVEHGQHTKQLRLYKVTLHRKSCDCHMMCM